MCHAWPRPVTLGPPPDPGSADPYCCEMAGATGHVSGPPFTDCGSCDMNMTATLPGGIPPPGTGGQLDSGCPGVAMRPNDDTLKFMPPRETVTFASIGQLFARKIAKHGGLMPA